MRKINYITLLFSLCFSYNVCAQLSTNEMPVSFKMKLDVKESKRSAVQVVTTPELDMVKIEAEDKEDEEYDMPPRFGYPHKVNYDLNNSGTWYTLPNGDKLWQLNVICPKALSVNFCYDKFWLPEGGKFFVYSKDRKHSIGAFTSRNNKGTRERLCGFATGLVYGEDVVLEYYQPKETEQDAIISIDMIVHGYRYINIGFGYSGSCQVNVNCDEGQEWQKEKNAVALILVNGNRYCTGSLINTTDLSRMPYLLTADHCLIDSNNESLKYDAVNSPNLYNYSFYWNYEAPDCTNVNVEPPFYSTQGATVIANNSYSDFALIQLSEDPKDLSNYTPYYLGWDWSGQSGLPGVCIHHPSGDIKKISTVAYQPVSDYWYNPSDAGSHWRVIWQATPHGHGTTEGGSSGSPLLNASHKVIGQLHGGDSSCDKLLWPDWFGKFDLSWTGNGNDSIQRRLDCWLDPQGAWGQTLDGLLVIPSSMTINTNQQLSENICIPNNVQVTIQSNVEINEDFRMVVESGGHLIIDGGRLNADLILRPGATLRIINDGTIDTCKPFETQIGVIVDIVYGKII